MRFQTLAAPVEHRLDPIKGSRFVGFATRTAAPDLAAAALRDVRQRWSDARHHCWAWRLADGRFRSSDDGEPGGSAGRPILAQIEGHGLHDVIVVVTRWFGGTKLGVGGLIRAYGGCAGRTLDRGALVEVVSTVSIAVRIAYADIGAVQAVLGARGLTPGDTDWGEAVCMQVPVPYDQVEAVTTALADATRGRAVVR